ncbi:TonB-dependent receptor plug domain-containing protein [Pseudomonadota bacterium]
MQKTNKIKNARLSIPLAVGLLCLPKVYAAESMQSDESAPSSSPPFTMSYEEDSDALSSLYEESFLITATGYAKPERIAPAVATIIDANEIKAMGATDLGQVLESVAGVHIYPSFDLMAEGYSIRGIHTKKNSQVLLLRNGIRVKNIIDGSRPNGFYMPISNISQIEVIRGPGSAVHGADAFAGVINIITKNADDIDGTHAGARTGSFSSHDAWVQHGTNHNDVGIAFNFEYSGSDGDRGMIFGPDQQSTFDNTFNTSVSLAFGALETRREVINTSLAIDYKEWDINLWHWRLNNGGTGPGAGHALDPVGRDNQQTYHIDITHKLSALHPDWDVTTHFNYTKQTFERTLQIFPPGSRVSIGSDGNITSPALAAGTVTFTDGILGNPGADENLYQLNTSAIYDASKQQRWRFGAGIAEQSIEAFESKNFGPGIIDGTISPIDGTLSITTNTSNIYMPNKNRSRWYALAQDEISFRENLELTVGVRYDNYSDFGSTTNPRAALVWVPRYDFTAKALYGRAFREPSLNELYLINNPIALGNPNLEPETIDTAELMFEYFPKAGLRTSLNLYVYDMDNSIAFTPDPGATTITAKNTEGQRGHGVELEVEQFLSNGINLRSNFAWQHSTLKSDGSRVADAPGLHFYFKGDWQFSPSNSFSSQLNWVANRKRHNNDSRSDVPDYTVVDVALRHARRKHTLEYALLVKNIFDRDIEEPSFLGVPDDYSRPSRSAHIELTLNFD